MIVIYGKEDCTYCVQAVQLCESKGLDYDYKSMGKHYEREELIDKISGEFGVIPRSMPQIVQDGSYVGGFRELKEKLAA